MQAACKDTFVFRRFVSSVKNTVYFEAASIISENFLLKGCRVININDNSLGQTVEFADDSDFSIFSFDATIIRIDICLPKEDRECIEER